MSPAAWKNLSSVPDTKSQILIKLSSCHYCHRHQDGQFVSPGLGTELFDQTPILVPLCRDFVDGINTYHQVSLRRLFWGSLVDLL